MDADIGGPRDHLANERTQLAWLRTAVNVMVLGLAIARFGDGGDASAGSVAAGAVLVLAGTAGIAYGGARYRATARELQRGEFGTVRSTTGPLVAAGVLVLAMLVAVVVLVVTGG